MSNDRLSASYAELPYESTPFIETHPEYLGFLGRMFGLNPAPAERCRYLELGCASGGNILPMAWNLPDSQFVGVDLAANQIADGQELIDTLKLKNIELHAEDIRHYQNAGQPFDYIVAHGLFSWVSEEVRQSILSACKRLLAPNGILYISYNVLPGWRMRGMVRDMLRFQTRDITNPVEAVEESHAFLQWMDSAVQSNRSFSARYLKEECQHLLNTHPSYLYHEYLEQENHAFLFSDFVQLIRSHGLHYLCDTDLRTMFPETLDSGIAQALEQVDDPLETEQYFDFLTARHFRQSILVHSEASVSYDWNLEQLQELHYFADLEAKKPADLKRAKPQSFVNRKGDTFDISHPLTKAAILHLSETYPDTLDFPSLLEACQTRVTQAGAAHFAEQTEHLLGELFSLLVHQSIGARITPYSYPAGDDQSTLQLSALSQQLLYRAAPLVGCHHEMVHLDPFAAAIIELATNGVSHDEMVNQMVDAIQSGALAIDGAANSPKKLRAQVESNIHHLLTLLTRQRLFR